LRNTKMERQHFGKFCRLLTKVKFRPLAFIFLFLLSGVVSDERFTVLVGCWE